MKEKIRAGLAQASSYYDNEIFRESGFENPASFKKNVVQMLLKHEPTLRGKKLLDVACGNGNFLECAELFFETCGIDFSRNAIALARQRCKKSKLYVSSAENLKFPSGSFDAITCLGSLEHFVDMHASLREMKRVLKKKGIAVIHVPNSAYLIHKILNVREHGQINERMATEKEWAEILSKYFRVERCYKYNTRFYLRWIPKRWCCHFTFVCRKS